MSGPESPPRPARKSPPLPRRSFQTVESVSQENFGNVVHHGGNEGAHKRGRGRGRLRRQGLGAVSLSST